MGEPEPPLIKNIKLFTQLNQNKHVKINQCIITYNSLQVEIIQKFCRFSGLEMVKLENKSPCCGQK
jgi:hypothetical protein